jgi:organic radical activating enzyme
MRGSNPARLQELNDGQSLWVQSVFYTLQGEGPFTGHPAVFIRLAGCNLKCFWCDTDFESSTWQPSLDDLLRQVDDLRPSSCTLIVITGGEPFRQNIAPLVERLLSKNLRVQIETNGTLWVEMPEHENLFIMCSPKTATLHESIIPRISAYKYVLAAGESDCEDGLPATSTQQTSIKCRIARPNGAAEIYVMPRDDFHHELNAHNLQTAVNTAKSHGYKLTIQTHKAIGIE